MAYLFTLVTTVYKCGSEPTTPRLQYHYSNRSTQGSTIEWNNRS